MVDTVSFSRRTVLFVSDEAFAVDRFAVALTNILARVWGGLRARWVC